MKSEKMCLTFSALLVILSIISIIFPNLKVLEILLGILSLLALIFAILSIVELRKNDNKITNDFIIVIIGALINILCGIFFGSFDTFGTLLVLVGIPGLISGKKE